MYGCKSGSFPLTAQKTLPNNYQVGQKDKTEKPHLLLSSEYKGSAFFLNNQQKNRKT